MILIVSINLIIRPTVTTAVIIAFASATASTSRLAVAITLGKISTWVMIKSLIALVIIALIAIILILALVYVLISLTSAMKILASEVTTCILVSIGSTTSGLTSIILIMVIIVSICIMVLIILCLWWQIFRFVLRLFAFSSTSRLGLLRMGPFERLGYIHFIFIIRMGYMGVQTGNCIAFSQSRQCSCQGSHFLIICSNSHFFSCLCQSFLSSKVCLYYGGHCIYKFVPLGLFFLP